ncbi:PRAME family member 12-like [Ictidomys tridecemlineatus]|uniref:PRAME family member 12-like n=1 Tax=Ictidomys tridecemlineatus TaxID=43179 RepID=UPI00038C116A|nr:PRAME family member 12-like [Ictidomys tridecemlineatus]KAG3289595.1 PRAME family member 12-like [Ictidomys tridecemlineatus]
MAEIEEAAFLDALDMKLRKWDSELPANCPALDPSMQTPEDEQWTPPTLQELAGCSLLKDKYRAILALEDLPIKLFPPLFMEAFSGGHTEVLKKMVQAWPFTCLLLGALMNMLQLGMIRVALDGLDMLAAQQDCPRRWKLQVLDLQKPLTHGNFWRTWSGAMVDACSPGVMKERQTVKASPDTGPTLPLKVLVNLCFQQRPLNAFLFFLFHWVDERKGLIQLCCNKLQMCPLPFRTIDRILERLDLDFIQQLDKERDQLMNDITSQFAKMDSLRGLYLDGVFLLDGRLCQVLRLLKTLLEILSITNCQFSDPDWNDLSGSPNLDQLIHLTLWDSKLTSFSPEPLVLLLENAAATLETLNLQDCGITNSQLQAILPVLSCCSQLRVLSFNGNDISMSVLSNLLLHTSRLTWLSLDKYPAPLESYDAQGAIHPGRLFQLMDELMEILRDVREPKNVLFYTKPCHRCGNWFIYNLPSSPCLCWLPA